MAFSRTKYDESNHQLQIQRSTEVGQYRFLASAQETCDRCYSYNGPVGSKGDVSMPINECMINFGDKTEAESHLTNRVIPLNRSNAVGANQSYLKFEPKNVHANNCNPKVNAVDTRFTHPLDAYRGMYTMEFKFTPYLHVNPQCQVYDRQQEVYSRFISRDNYIIPKQEKWDKGESLPKPSPAPQVVEVKDQCAVCAK